MRPDVLEAHTRRAAVPCSLRVRPIKVPLQGPTPALVVAATRSLYSCADRSPPFTRARVSLIPSRSVTFLVSTSSTLNWTKTSAILTQTAWQLASSAFSQREHPFKHCNKTRQFSDILQKYVDKPCTSRAYSTKDRLSVKSGHWNDALPAPGSTGDFRKGISRFPCLALDSGRSPEHEINLFSMTHEPSRRQNG
ncbi:unnamed protein product [Nesidiocoris tenuis]|uniref:Uncharacterized protein n=1 Tax=Nesidiocoris tenuis TaxID=355587 RepID=A0A6H5H899_9HEMI|nr:unnamed protein product [Nesidiocoris tenuis]